MHHIFCILYFCHSCSLCRVKLVVQFPASGSTQVLLCPFPGVLWLWHFLYSVGPHPVSSPHIYTFVVSRAFTAGAASQALTLPGHLVSPLLCRGPWISTVVLYCWCRSDSAIVHLYFACTRLIEYITTLRKGQGNPVGMSMICNPRWGLLYFIMPRTYNNVAEVHVCMKVTLKSRVYINPG